MPWFSFHSSKTSCVFLHASILLLYRLCSPSFYTDSSVLHLLYSSLSTLSPFWFVRHCHLSHKVPLPAFSFMHVFSSTNTSPCIPAFIPLSPCSTSPPCCVSLYLLLLPPVTNALPSSVCLPHKLTISLAVFVTDTFGVCLSVSLLACWDRISKNTARGYLTTYACGSEGVHKCTLSIYTLRLLLPVCVCVCVWRGLQTGYASVSDMVLPSFHDKP